ASGPARDRLFVTLPGTNQFAVVDNTASPPALLGGTIYNLPTTGATDSAGGVTVPAVATGATSIAYFSVPGSNQVDLVDNNGSPPPTTDATANIALTGVTTPRRIASIPVPGAGLGFLNTTLPDAVSGRS